MGTSPVDDIDRRRRNRPLAAWRKALAIEGRTYGEIATEVGYANCGTAYKVRRHFVTDHLGRYAAPLIRSRIHNFESYLRIGR